MLSAFDPATGELGPLDPDRPPVWVHASAPTDDDLAQLEEVWAVPPELLEHALDIDELARIDHDAGGATLVVLRVPWARPPGSAVPHRSTALGIVLTRDRVVTVARYDTDVIEEVLALHGVAPGRPQRFVVQLALVTADHFLRHLRAIDDQIGRIEDALHQSQRNRELVELLRYQKALVHFTTALSSNQIMLERLQKDLSAEDHDLLDDALVELRQAIEMTRLTADTLSQTADAFATIISNNLNVVMKILTTLTLVLTLPNIVASLWGMNVPVPGQGRGDAFLWILGGSAGLAGVVALIFVRKRWL
jgi:magnesium transporter